MQTFITSKWWSAHLVARTEKQNTMTLTSETKPFLLLRTLWKRLTNSAQNWRRTSPAPSTLCDPAPLHASTDSATESASSASAAQNNRVRFTPRTAGKALRRDEIYFKVEKKCVQYAKFVLQVSDESLRACSQTTIAHWTHFALFLFFFVPVENLQTCLCTERFEVALIR